MWLFLLSPLGRKLAGAAAVAVLLAGTVYYIYNKGKAAGYADGQRAQMEQDRVQFEQDRKVFLDELAKYKERDDAAKAEISQRDSELQSLRSNRTRIHGAVAAIPAPALVADIQSRMGSVVSGTLGEADLRRIDEALAAQQNLEAQVAALEAKSAQQDKRIDAIEHQRDSAITAYNNLVPLYSRAYNAAQKKHSMFVKIITFGLVRDRKLDLPEPATLERP
jgi:hypothetical protein